NAAATLSRLLHSPPIPTMHPFSHHPYLLSVHVGAGMVAILAGLPQFLPAFREKYLHWHRRLGYAYLGAVLIGGVAAIPLAFVFFDPLVPELRAKLLPARISFGVLAVVWLFTSAMAFFHVRSGRIVQHRAWMLRSYSL